MFHRLCNDNHPCTKKCFMECGKCTTSMIKKLPCGHQHSLPCFVDILKYPCEEMVGLILITFNSIIVCI